MKRIPYALSNFERIRTENYLYVDKTHFIEHIENEDTQYHFLTRPRKFGKSLFLSTLDHYYDIRHKDKFEQLFGDLYIGQHPTQRKNDMFVLNFEFSGIDTSSINDFNISLLEKIKMAVIFFITDHRDFIENIDEAKDNVWKMEKASTCIEYALDVAKNHSKKVFVIVDEYDHFANDMIAAGRYLGEENYKKTVWAGSQVRDFYETLKANSRTVIDKIFITGITPIMLDDLTSGFNISNNLSIKEKYNDILGFTKDELEWIIRECGIDKSLINIDVEYFYNGYLFAGEAINKLYNPTMIFNYLTELRDNNGRIKNYIDYNLKTDYGRLRRLISKGNNKEKLSELIETKSVSAKVIQRFSIEFINDYDNFFSLLFYMGLITIDNSSPFRQRLKIPNYSIKTMFWEYIEHIERENNPDLFFDNSKIINTLETLAYDNDAEPFLRYFQENILANLSNRDMQNFNEKSIKILLLGILFQSNLYLPISELENSEGYCDIYLQKKTIYPANYEWIWELKYIKTADSENQALIAEKKQESISQLQRYRNSNLFKERKDVRYLSTVFVGKKDCLIEEI